MIFLDNQTIQSKERSLTVSDYYNKEKGGVTLWDCFTDYWFHTTELDSKTQGT